MTAPPWRAGRRGVGAQIRAGTFVEAGAGSRGSAPDVWMTDALQGQRGAPSQDTPRALSGDQLAGVRQGAPAARQLDGLGDAGGRGGLAPALDRPAAPLAGMRLAFGWPRRQTERKSTRLKSS